MAERPLIHTRGTFTGQHNPRVKGGHTEQCTFDEAIGQQSRVRGTRASKWDWLCYPRTHFPRPWIRFHPCML